MAGPGRGVGCCEGREEDYLRDADAAGARDGGKGARDREMLGEVQGESL